MSRLDKATDCLLASPQAAILPTHDCLMRDAVVERMLAFADADAADRAKAILDEHPRISADWLVRLLHRQAELRGSVSQEQPA